MSYVYFAKRKQVIKIGLSGNPHQRMLALGRGIELLGVIPRSSRATEQRLHKRFASFAAKSPGGSRADGTTEWFHCSPALMTFIQEHALPPPKPQKRKRIIAWVPQHIHRRLKWRAAMDVTTIQHLLAEAVESWLKRKEKKAA